MKTWVDTFFEHGDKAVFVGGSEQSDLSYVELAENIKRERQRMMEAGIDRFSVVAFPGRYGPHSLSLFFAIADLGATAVPLPDDSEQRLVRLMSIAQATHHASTLESTNRAASEFSRLNADASHPLYRSLHDAKHAGLILFTSGSTGDPKAAVQDIDRLRLRYCEHRDVGKMLAFMQMDHIGGINTMLYVLTHGGTLVVPRSRSPQDVAAIIEQHRIEVLPVSPTFLNLMLVTGVIEQNDVSSLRRVTYGSEPMPESVLKRLGEALPGVDLLQTYGTTEMGILKSKSERNDSLWMKIGGDGYETKVADGRLWIRAQTAMLGYLNATSPFDEDGFMDTGDEVEVRGEWMRILGRKSEFINVGGIKVSPTEIESVLMEMPNVCEASVTGMEQPLMGQVVRVNVRLTDSTSIAEFKSAMRKHCKDRLPQQAIPVKISLSKTPLITDRFKRARGD